MPGMNRNSRSIRLIETYLADLESNPNATSADAMLVLDEIRRRRLERKWNEQVAAGSTRRIESDFRTMKGWLRRWALPARRVTDSAKDPVLQDALTQVQQTLRPE